MNKRLVRRALHVCGGSIAAALACGVVAAGGLEGASGVPTLSSVLVFASVTVLVITAIARRINFEPPTARAQRVSLWLSLAPALADVEVALALVGGVYAVLQVSGGIDSAAYPLLYGVVAFTVSFQSRSGAVAAVGSAIALELAAYGHSVGGRGAMIAVTLHIAFVLGAAAVHAVFIRGMVWRYRRGAAQRLAEEVETQRQSAADYRLISAPLGADSRGARTRNEQETLLAAGGVAAIQSSVFYTLAQLKTALGAHTVALLWLERDGRSLEIKEMISDANDLTEQRAVRAKGVLGALVRDGRPLMMPRTKPGQLPYHDSDFTGAFCGVPVKDGPHLRGALCVDRADEAFTDTDLQLLDGASEQILRAIQSERVFLAIERAKYEHERFYHASAMLCRALTLEDVMETAFDAAAQIVDYDAAAITLFDEQRNRHRVYSVRVKPGAEKLIKASDLDGLEFRSNAGLAAMVVKNKHYLPAGGEIRDISAPVYTRKIKLRDAESLVVLPLLSGDSAIGTFMLAARKAHQFRKDVREMLGIIANQVAVSLQNGMMYQKMETMATTDGLTGLTNHRTFQERFENLLARSARHGHEAAFLLCDVDHFKNVNDTYGHPVGDEVLRRVARVLMDAVRKIDITARYGGEEFVVVLEATGLEGAVKLAERIREDVGKLVLDSEKGTFKVTMSIGVSAFPDDSTDRAELIDRADQALYHAKESGRNRVVTYQEKLAAGRRVA